MQLLTNVSGMDYFLRALVESKKLGPADWEVGFCEEEAYILRCLVKEEPIDFDRVSLNALYSMSSFAGCFDSDYNDSWTQIEMKTFLPMFWHAFTKHDTDFMDIHPSQLELAELFWKMNMIGIDQYSYHLNYLDKWNHFESYDDSYFAWGFDVVRDAGYDLTVLDPDEDVEELTKFAEAVGETTQELQEHCESYCVDALEVIDGIEIANPALLKELSYWATEMAYETEQQRVYIYHKDGIGSIERIGLLLDILCIAKLGGTFE